MYIRKKTKIKLIYISIGLGTFILLLSTIFAITNIFNSKIIKGVSISGIDVSNLAENDARIKISNNLTVDSNLNLSYGDYSFVISPSDIDFKLDIESAAREAYKVGRSKNPLFNNYVILFGTFFTKDIKVNYTYNKEKLDSIIEAISYELPGLVENPSYYIDGDSLIIKAGKTGIQLNEEELKNSIINTFFSLKADSPYIVDVSISTKEAKPIEIDIEKIYKEIKCEPQDAYVEKDPFKLHLGVDGVDFAISLEEVKQRIQEEKEEYVIPLAITHPKVTTNDLGDSIFTYTVAKYSTRYDVSNTNRATNVELATAKLNNAVIQPGETFSYNKTVGERTIAAGYKDAAIYTSNGVAIGLGGGICQVSSTLYNVALEANFEIVERTNHIYTVSYVPLGKDATISYGALDLKFKNTRSYPVKLVTSAKNGVLEITLLGVEEETEYDITILPEMLEATPYNTKTIYDSTLAEGEEIVLQEGSNGYKYQTYKIVSKNGIIISKEIITTDTYYPLTKVVKVGTKK